MQAMRADSRCKRTRGGTTRAHLCCSVAALPLNRRLLLPSAALCSSAAAAPRSPLRCASAAAASLSSGKPSLVRLARLLDAAATAVAKHEDALAVGHVVHHQALVAVVAGAERSGQLVPRARILVGTSSTIKLP